MDGVTGIDEIAKRKLAGELSRIVNTPIEEGKTNTPSIGLIADVFGEDLVELVLLTLATSYGYERRTGHPEARHPIDIMVRPLAWPLDWYNTPETMRKTPLHDGGERIGTIAGALAINHGYGIIVGSQKLEEAVNDMNDFNSMGLKYARDNGPVLGGKNTGLTREDIIKDVRASMRFFSRNYKNHQIAAINQITRDWSDYIRYLASQDTPQEDKDRIKKFVDSWKKAFYSVHENPLPRRPVLEFIEFRLETLVKVLEDEFPDGRDGAFFDDRGSYTFHAAREAGYRSYVREVIGKGHGNLKIGDNADSLRLTNQVNMDETRAQYRKSNIVTEETESYLQGREGEDNLGNQLRFLKAQRVIKILGDYNAVAGYPDRGHDQLRDWLPGEFSRVHEQFGPELMQYVRANLRKNPNALAMEESTADILIPVYDKLMEYIKPPGPLTRMARSMSKGLRTFSF